MDTIDTNAWAVLAELLDMARDEFSNHGCGDFELLNTPENRALMETAETWNSPDLDRDGELYISNISKDGKKIYTQDWFLMAYFAHLARELAGEKE